MRYLLGGCLFIALCLTGCSAAEPLRTPRYRLGIENALTQSDMRLDIQNGVLAAGWDIKGEKDGATLAAVSASDYRAEVVIEYRPGAYRIRRWKTSATLHYDDGHISWRYNGWVDRLDTYLRQEIAKLVALKNAARVTIPPPMPPPRNRQIQPPPPTVTPETPPPVLTPAQATPAEPEISEDSEAVAIESSSPDTDDG